jgi:hypothetical protein
MDLCRGLRVCLSLDCVYNFTRPRWVELAKDPSRDEAELAMQAAPSNWYISK